MLQQGTGIFAQTVESNPEKKQGKGKLASRMHTVTDELQYLMTFNQSVSQAMVKPMEHLSDFIFISMANITLARRDSYLAHLRSGIKPDTLAALRTTPLHMVTFLMIS